MKGTVKTSKATLELNEEKGGGVIIEAANYAEVHKQSLTTITGEAKTIPEWMKGTHTCMLAATCADRARMPESVDARTAREALRCSLSSSRFHSMRIRSVSHRWC
jgi:hypothetical protein